MENLNNNILEEIKSIHGRNRRVEADKAWETSWFRIFSICVITYACAAVLLFLIGATNFLLGALVPVLGYFLSTQSLPAVKRWWIKNYFNKNK
jgi:hypothetical protein